MIDRAITEAVTYRVAVAALSYYDGKEDTQPGYSLRDDVRWCLEPLKGEVSAAAETTFTWLISSTITDPTANRERLSNGLAAVST
jgi:hypothetical protein